MKAGDSLGKALASTVLYVFFLFWYMRFIVIQPLGLPGNSSISDFYFNFFVWKQQLSMIRQGFAPFGTFWLGNHIGGYPISLTPFNGWEDLPNFVATAIYAVSGDFLLTLRLIIYGSFIMSGAFSYIYGRKITKQHTSSLIASLAYTFSTQHFADLNYGHMNLLVGFSTVPIVLLICERQFERPNLHNAILASLSLVLLFFVEWQCLLFTIVFLTFRFVWFLEQSRSRQSDSRELLRYSAGSFVLFTLLTAPFLVFTLYYYGTKWTTEALVGVPVSSYFIRSTFFRLGWDIPYNYIGITILSLILLPVIRRTCCHRTTPRLKDQYGFFLIMSVFFIFYSAASHAPLNVASLAHNFLPFASSIRVVGRSSVFVYLCTGISAGIGYLKISNHFRSWLDPENYQRPLTKLLKQSLPLVVCILIFADITLGFEPIATDYPYLPSNSGYNFVRNQQGDFRVMEIPQFYGLSTITSNYVGHEVLDYRPLYLKERRGFSDIYDDFLRLDQNLLFFYDSNSGDLDHWIVSHPESSKYHVGLVSSSHMVQHPVLSISLNSSRPGDRVELRQTLQGRPEITSDFFFAVTFLMKDHNSRLDIIVELENDQLNKATLNYSLCTDDQSCSNDNRTIQVKSPNAWSSVQRNMLADLQGGFQGKWYGRMVRIIVRSQPITRDIRADATVFIDSVAIYKHVDIFTKATLYGVKYLILNTDIDFLSKWMMMKAWSLVADNDKLLKIASYLEINEDFRLAYRDSSVHIYENTHFKGLIFPLKPESKTGMKTTNILQSVDAFVSSSRTDPNTLFVSIEAKEPCLLIISQNYFKGWEATDGSREQEISVVQGTCAIYLDQGTHHLKLHFEPYEQSLLLFPFFYFPVLYILVVGRKVGFANRKCLKLLGLSFAIYGSFLVVVPLLTLVLLRVVPELPVFLSVLIWLGLSSNVGAAMIPVLFEGRNTNGLSIRALALAMALLSIPIAYLMQNLGNVNNIMDHWLISATSICTSVLVLRNVTTVAKSERRSSILDLVTNPRCWPGFVHNPNIQRISILVAILASIVTFSSLFSFHVAPVWENNLFKGYAFYYSSVGRPAFLFAAAIMIGLTRLFWPCRGREMFSTYTLVPIGTMISSMLTLNLYLSGSEYVFVSSNPFESIVLATLVCVFVTISLLMLHVEHGPIVMREKPTLEEAFARSPVGILAVLVLLLSICGMIFQDNMSISGQLFGYGAFSIFILVVFLYTIRRTIGLE